MKKSLVLALVAVLVLSFASMAFAFTDTPDWAKGQIDKLAEMKIVNGVSATSFNAAGNVTRAEFAKMIVLSKGIALENPATATFKDVPATAWYFPYVEAAAKAKLIDGIGDGKFAPTANITREQVAKIVVLAAGKTADATKALNFDDKASISDWAKGFVAVAADLKLMQGSNNKFAPKNNATRAEGAVLVYNELVFEGKVTVAKAPGTVDDYSFVGDGLAGNTIVIDGKSYDLTTDCQVTANGKKVGLNAIQKNKTIKFELTSTSDSANIFRITIGSDYVIKTGALKETGTDKDNPYLVIGSETIHYDSAKLTASKIQTLDSSDDVSNGSLTVNDEYLIFVNADGKVYYAFDTTSKAAKGTLQSIGKDDKGDYVAVDGKKYYAKKNGGDPDGSLVDVTKDGVVLLRGTAAGEAWGSLKAKDVVELTTNADGYVTFIKATSYLPSYRVSNKVMYALKAGSTVYNMFLQVKAVQANGTLGGVAYIKSPTTVSTVPSDYAVVGEPGTFTETKDLTVNIDGVSAKFQDIAKNSYIEVTTNTDGKINKITAISAAKAYVVGTLESFTKVTDSTDDNYNKVTKVKVAGKEYAIDTDKTAANGSSGKGTISGLQIQNGNIVALVLNASSEVTAVDYVFDVDATETVDSATVVAVAGDKSIMTALATSSTTYPTIYVPDNTIEVKYWDGSSWKYTWLTQEKYQAIDDSDKVVYTKMVDKNNLKITLGDIKVGDTISAGVVKADGTVDAVSTFVANVWPTTETLTTSTATKDFGAPVYATQSGRWTTDFEINTTTNAHYTSNWTKVIIKKN